VSTVHIAEHQHQGADLDRGYPRGKHGMRRAENFDLEPVGVMPPVVEGRGDQHSDAAPRGDERPQGPVKSPHPHGGETNLGQFAEAGGQDQVGRRNARNNAAQVDRHMRRGPEGVAADGAVPGNIPLDADHRGGDADHRGPQVPGDR
jgi:hypothetical protein